MPEIEINTGKAVEELAKLEKALGSTITKSGKFAGALQKGFVDPLIKATSNLATLTNVLNSSTASFSTFATTIQKAFKDLNKISQAKGASGKNAFGTLKEIIKSLNNSSRGISTGSFPKAAAHFNQLANGLTKLAQADMSAVLSNVNELPKFLLLFENMKSSGVDKIGSGMNALMRAMRGISKVDMAAFRKNIVYISIDVRRFVNMMGIVTKSPNFIAFERLADAMFKVALASKSLVTATKKVNSAMKQMNGTAKKSKGIFGKLTPTIKQFFTAFVGYNVIHAVTRAIKGSISAFAELELGMARVNTIARTSQVVLGRWTQQVMHLSKGLGLPLEDLSKALYDINSATIIGSDAMLVLEASANSAVAGFTSIDKTAELLSRVINAYGYTAKEASHISDILFKTVERGINPMEDLAQYMGRVLTVAANAGVSFEEVAAAIATMTSRGIQTNIAVTSLNSALLKFSAGNKQLDAVFRKHGYTSTAAALRYGGLTKVLEILNKETHGYTDNLMKLKHNYRDIRAVSVLASSAFTEYTNNLRLMSDESEVAGATQNALGQVTDTLSKKFDMLKNSVLNLGIALADTFSLKDIIGGLNSYIDTLSNGIRTLSNVHLRPATSIWDALAMTSEMMFDALFFIPPEYMGKGTDYLDLKKYSNPIPYSPPKFSPNAFDYTEEDWEWLKRSKSATTLEGLNRFIDSAMLSVSKMAEIDTTIGIDYYIQSLKVQYKKLSEMRSTLEQEGLWIDPKGYFDMAKVAIENLSSLRKEMSHFLSTQKSVTTAQEKFNKLLEGKEVVSFANILADLKDTSAFVKNSIEAGGIEALLKNMSSRQTDADLPKFSPNELANINTGISLYNKFLDNYSIFAKAAMSQYNSQERQIQRAQRVLDELPTSFGEIKTLELFEKISDMGDKNIKDMLSAISSLTGLKSLELGEVMDSYIKWSEATQLLGKPSVSKKGLTIKPSPSVAAASAAEVGTKEAVDLVSRQVFKDTYDVTKRMKTIQELILKQLKYITEREDSIDVTRFILVD